MQCAPVNDNQDDHTILIDFEKYQEFHQPNVASSNKTNAEVCSDGENKEYRKCGNKCVLSCRYTLYSSKFPISSDECSKKTCVEGCFCKDGYVRHYDKCILAKECPVRNGRASEPSSFQPGTFLRHFGMGCGLKGCASGSSSGTIGNNHYNSSVQTCSSLLTVFSHDFSLSTGSQPIHIYLPGDDGSGS